MIAADSPEGFSPAAHPYRWVMLAGLWLVYFCFGMTVAALAPLVGTITGELGLSNAAMGSVLGAWPLVYIAAAIPCGAFLDRVGPRRALFLGALIIGLSGVMRGFATGHATLFVAVAIFGFGGPLVSVGAPKLISLWFEGKERGLAMGLYITGPALGGIAALSLTNSVAMPLAGGDWRAVLLGYAAFVLAAGVVWLFVSSHPASREVERRIAAEPQRPQLAVFAELLRLPAVRLVLVMGVCTLFINHGLNNWLPQILRGYGMDAATAGYWASVPTAVGVIGALLIPRLAVPSRRLKILFSLMACYAVASLLLQTTHEVTLGTGLVLQGIARGSITTVIVLSLVEMKDVGARSVGSASGLFFSAAEVGGVLGPLTMGVVSDATGGFSAALYLLTAISILLMLLLSRLRLLIRTDTVPVSGRSSA